MKSKAKMEKSTPGVGSLTGNATSLLPMRQERFVHEYLADPRRNATAAYVRAGYRARGGAARAAAARLIRHPSVQAAIAAIRNADARKYDIARERVIEQYASIAFVDPRNFFRSDGTVKMPQELDEATAAALTMFEIRTQEPVRGGRRRPRNTSESSDRNPGQAAPLGQTTRVKWADKRAALDSLVRLMGYTKGTDETNDSPPENPLSALIQDIQLRGSTLVPAEIVSDND